MISFCLEPVVHFWKFAANRKAGRATGRPTGLTDRPTRPTDRPAGPTDRPTGPTDRPTDRSARPTDQSDRATVAVSVAACMRTFAKIGSFSWKCGVSLGKLDCKLAEFGGIWGNSGENY